MDFTKTLEVLQEATGFFYVSIETEGRSDRYLQTSGKFTTGMTGVKKFASRADAKKWVKDARSKKVNALSDKNTVHIDFKRGAPVNESISDDLDELIVKGSLPDIKLKKLQAAGLVDGNGNPTKKAKEEYSELFD